MRCKLLTWNTNNILIGFASVKIPVYTLVGHSQNLFAADFYFFFFFKIMKRFSNEILGDNCIKNFFTAKHFSVRKFAYGKVLHTHRDDCKVNKWLSKSEFVMLCTVWIFRMDCMQLFFCSREQ